MDIFDWLKERGVKFGWAAEELIGCHYTTLYRINKTGIACEEIADQIYEVTDGEVDYRREN